MPTVRTLILPTDGADPSAVLASLFSRAAGIAPTLVDGDGEILDFIIADPSDSIDRAYDARPIPNGTTAKLALGNPLTGVLYAEVDAFVPLPVAGYTVTPIQVGSGTQPAIVEIALAPAPYGGTWTVDGLALNWDASETDFMARPPAFTVQKTGTFTWRMTGTANGAYSPAVSVSGLLVPTGLQFLLDLSTATALALAFGQAGSDEITAQLTLRVTFPGGSPATFYLSDVPVALSVLSFAVVPGGGAALAAVATSGSAADLTTGTLLNARLSSTVTTAIAQAAAADTPAARNTAIAAALATLPAPVDPSAYPIQPPSAFVECDYIFQLSGSQETAANNYANIIDLRDRGIESIDPAYFTSNLNANRYLSGSTPHLLLGSNGGAGNALQTAALGSIIATAAAWCTANNASIYLDVSGPGNGSPDLTTGHQDASVTIQLPAPIPANAGLVYSITAAGGGSGLTVNYDATIPLSASALTPGPGITSVTTVGVQDSPSMADAVATINALLSNGGVGSVVGSDTNPAAFDATGAFTGQDTIEVDYPVTFAGPGIVASSPGVVSTLSAAITAIDNLGGTVIYNP